MESVLRWLLHEAGLPAPELQYVVRDDAGGFLGRADLAWPDQEVLVEFDGAVHRERDVFVNDLGRQNSLVGAGGAGVRVNSAAILGRGRRGGAQNPRGLWRGGVRRGRP